MSSLWTARQFRLATGGGHLRILLSDWNSKVTEQPQTPFSLILERATDVIHRLPRIGRLMIINSREGVTHERIGLLEATTAEGEWLVCTGDAHHCRIHVPSIAKMVIDTSSAMAEKAYPRIDCYDSDDRAMFSVVSFEGLDPFLAAIEDLKTEPCLDARSPFEIKERSEALPDDQGLVPLHAALTSGAVVAIGITRPGFSQEWEGIIEKLVPSMGFINVMVPDFHFHLRAGAIGYWKRASNEDGITLDAYDQNGAPLGLTLSSSSVTAFDVVEPAL